MGMNLLFPKFQLMDNPHWQPIYYREKFKEADIERYVLSHINTEMKDVHPMNSVLKLEKDDIERYFKIASIWR